MELTGRLRWVKKEYLARYLKGGSDDEESGDEEETEESGDEEVEKPKAGRKAGKAEKAEDATVPSKSSAAKPVSVGVGSIPVSEDFTPAVAQKKLLESESLKGEERLDALRQLLGQTAAFGPEYSLVILSQILAVRVRCFAVGGL
jgi:hypothetical protein